MERPYWWYNNDNKKKDWKRGKGKSKEKGEVIKETKKFFVLKVIPTPPWLIDKLNKGQNDFLANINILSGRTMIKTTDLMYPIRLFNPRPSSVMNHIKLDLYIPSTPLRAKENKSKGFMEIPEGGICFIGVNLNYYLGDVEVEIDYERFLAQETGEKAPRLPADDEQPDQNAQAGSGSGDILD